MAAPAYYRYATAPATAPQRMRRTPNRSNVRVVPGSRSPKTSQAPSGIAIAAVAIAAVLVIFALLSFARVAISSATIATSIESQTLSSQIESARSEGNQLEVNESALANSNVIKEKATKLGMSEAYVVGTITLPQDVVAKDSNGNIALAESVRRAASAA